MAIIQLFDRRNLAALMRWNQANPHNAPFVKIGRLLLAIDQTGADAWQALVVHLRRVYRAQQFVIYSGRHGALEGCFYDNGEVPVEAPDRHFFEDDLREVDPFVSRMNLQVDLRGVQIEIADTGRLPKNIYRRRIGADLMNKDKWVIVSWCHSIASMSTMPNYSACNEFNNGPGGVRWISAQNNARRSVREIVESEYSWVQRP